MLTTEKLTNHHLNSVWMLCDNSKVHYFHFSHRQKPNVPSSSQVRKTNVNKQRLFLALWKDFFRCFCRRQRSHCCFSGQTISRFCWLRWPERWLSGQHPDVVLSYRRDDCQVRQVTSTSTGMIAQQDVSLSDSVTKSSHLVRQKQQ